MIGPILWCGVPHGQFRQIVSAAVETRASAVVLLGDLEPQEPLHLSLASLVERAVPVFNIHGNQDADSDEGWLRVWRSELADRSPLRIEVPRAQPLAR